MISLIVCSQDARKFAAVEAMYAAALGAEPWEMIHIEDAASLAEGYTRGVARSRGDRLVFSHDDVEILNPPTFFKRLNGHLSNYDLIGVAGTRLLTSSSWFNAGPPHIFGQVAHPQPDGNIIVDIYGAPRPIVGMIQAIDGVFMAARRPVLSRVAFDAATFDGFHFYDMDFSFSAYRAGFRLAVANDLHLLHASAGKYGYEDWVKYDQRFTKKWQPHLSRANIQTFQRATVTVASKAAAVEVMDAPYWSDSAAL
jgi:GT2 family glycosyltransferase